MSPGTGGFVPKTWGFVPNHTISSRNRGGRSRKLIYPPIYPPRNPDLPPPKTRFTPRIPGTPSLGAPSTALGGPYCISRIPSQGVLSSLEAASDSPMNYKHHAQVTRPLDVSGSQVGLCLTMARPGPSAPERASSLEDLGEYLVAALHESQTQHVPRRRVTGKRKLPHTACVSVDDGCATPLVKSRKSRRTRAAGSVLRRPASSFPGDASPDELDSALAEFFPTPDSKAGCDLVPTYSDTIMYWFKKWKNQVRP